ncbi:MAG: 16S rRNA (guanine(527)-N(7))-methyltransferase RsmG [Holosporales bacterium]|nr:16S rRNA (guanine(527)-N(7))-methyltransferase RsmG [Holosporales bacterium]
MDSDSTIDEYVRLLDSWNSKMNLVRSDGALDIVDRHVRDSQQICNYIDLRSAVLDVGSGAGFPGVILSICGFERVILCENNFKRSTFLNDVKERLELKFDILSESVYKLRVDDCVSRGISSDVTMVSRAFGSLVELMTIMHMLEIRNGVFHKGRNYSAEVQDAGKKFEFDLQTEKSATSNDGVIVLVSNLERK